jgi:hypothetical protein
MSMGTRLRFFILSILCMVSAACANRPSANEEMRFMSTIPRCTGEKDCEFKWAAARRWIVSEFRGKLHHHGPDFMETVDPERDGVGARVMKEPVDTNTYRIVIDTWCRGAGCFLSQLKLKQSFNDYVNGEPGSAAP